MSSATAAPTAGEFTGLAARYTETSKETSAFSLDEVTFTASSLSPTQALVKVACAAVNPIDYKVMEGIGWYQPFPFTMGYDLSGTVVAAGAEVTNVKEGDPVFAVHWGNKNEGPPGNFHDDGGSGPVGGAFASYCVIEAAKLSKKPAELPWDVAAGMALVGTTAVDCLNQVGVGEGCKLLVLGGAGAVGAAAVQLAKECGAYVVTTASERTMEYVQGLGADRIINYRETNWWEDEALKGFDAVFHTTSEKDGLEHAKLILKPDGAFISITDFTTGFDPAAHAPLKYAAFRALTNSAEVQDNLAQLVLAGKLKVQIDTQFPFTKEGIVEMLEKQKSGKSIGKNVVIVDPSM